MNTSMNISNRSAIGIAAVTIILTLVLVRFPLPFLYGIELLLFTSVSWYVYLRFSLQYALLLATIGTAFGIFLWGQSPILVLCPIEILVVGWIAARTKRSIMFWDMIYWFTLGSAGFYMTYDWLTESSDSNIVILLLLSIASGLLNVFLGELAAEYVPLLGSRSNNTKAKWRISRISYHIYFTLLLLPILIYLLVSGHLIYKNSLSEISVRFDTLYSHVKDRLNHLSETELRDLKVRSALQIASLQDMFVNLTTGTDVQLILVDSNRHVVAALDPSIANSRSVYDWDRGGTVNPLSETIHLWQPDDIPAYNEVYRWANSEFVSVYRFERLPFTLITKQSAATFQQDMFNLYFLSLLLIGLTSLISAAIAYRITRRLTQSMTELGEFSSGLPRKIHVREPIEWKDSLLYEVDFLKNNFKDMSKELAHMFDKVNQSKEQLRLLAHTDTLTGLGNRYSFNQYLPAVIREAEARNSRVACLFIDFDHFKSINDAYGHAAGDAVLMEAGVRLKRYNTEQIKAFRLSGDEFVVVMSEPLPDDLEQWACEIHDALVNTEVSFQDHRIQIELSVGVSLYPDHGQDAEGLLRSSDGAMYQAKVNGRNRVRVSNSFNAGMKGGDTR